MDEERAKLKRICNEIVKDEGLQPRDGKTFCNFAVQRICSVMGVADFHGKTANEICAFVTEEWTQIDVAWAQEFALSGGVVIAAQFGKPHGHVAVVYPGIMVFSVKWNCHVPQVANVGGTNGIMGVNNAFQKKPGFYVKPAIKEE